MSTGCWHRKSFAEQNGLLIGSLNELHYCTLELGIRDAFLHFYSNQTMDFPSLVTFKHVKIRSCLELRCKVKYVYIFNEAQMCRYFMPLRVPEPEQSKPFQCCCSASVGRYLHTTQSVPVPKRLLPPTPSCCRHTELPMAKGICFHYIELLWWKIFPMVPSMSNCGCLPIEQTTLKQSSSSSPLSPSQMLP